MPDTDTETEGDVDPYTDIPVGIDDIEELHEARLAYEEALARFEECKARVKASAIADADALGTAKARGVDPYGNSAFTLARRSSMRFNSTRFRRELPDVYRSYTEPSPETWYFTVSKPRSES